MTALDSIQVPTDIQEPLQNPKWATVVKEGVQALEKSGTWEFSTLPKGKKQLGANGFSLLSTMLMEVLTDTKHV